MIVRIHGYRLFNGSKSFCRCDFSVDVVVVREEYCQFGIDPADNFPQTFAYLACSGEILMICDSLNLLFFIVPNDVLTFFYAIYNNSSI